MRKSKHSRNSSYVDETGINNVLGKIPIKKRVEKLKKSTINSLKQ